MLYKQKGMLGRCLGSSGTDVLGRTTESLYMWLGSSCVWGGAGPKTAKCVPDTVNNCCWLQENARNCFLKSSQKESLAGWSRVTEFSAREVHGYVGHGTADAALDTPGSVKPGHHMVPSSPLGPVNIHVTETHVIVSAPGLCPGVPCMISPRTKGCLE